MSTINRLLSIPDVERETKDVLIPRLGLTVTLQEIDYNTIMSCRRNEDNHFHYLLKSTVSPNFKDPAWYQEKMGCPTPVEAMKKLFRPGEVEKVCRVADVLNGYGDGSVSVIDATEKDLEEATTGAACEELEKN